MPGMDGLDFAEKAHEIYPNAVIVILTGYDSFAYAQKAISIGVEEYLLKPVDYDELKAMAALIAGVIHARKEIQQEISNELSHNKIGKEFKVIIDRKEGDYYIGRTEFDSPEVDPEVLIKDEGRMLRTGSFHQVKVYDADDFDLYATLV